VRAPRNLPPNRTIFTGQNPSSAPVRVRKETICALMWLLWSHCPPVEANSHKTSWPNGLAPVGLGHARSTTSEHDTVATDDDLVCEAE
jgi:hypothetical protein